MAGIGALCGRKLLRSGKYSDLTIACEGKDFHVHKAIVCTASPLLGGRCELYSEDEPEHKIQALDDDPAIVQMMLEHLYTRQYDVGKPLNTTAPTNKDKAKTPLPVGQLDAPSEAINGDAAHGSSVDMSELVDHMKYGNNPAKVEEITRQSRHALSQHMKLYKLAHSLLIAKTKEAAADNIIHESENLALTSKRFPSLMRQMLHDYPFSADVGLRARLLVTCLDQVGMIRYAVEAEPYDPELIVLLRKVEPLALQYAERCSVAANRTRWDLRLRKVCGTD